jgi:HK97 gp10 family phage protein
MEVKGIEELNKRLFALDKDISDKMGNALLEGGKLIETDCKQSATAMEAVDTGRMRASISTDLISNKEVHVAPHVDYAKYVEYGTSRMPYARPFMKSGFEHARPKAIEYIRKKLGEEVKMGFSG